MTEQECLDRMVAPGTRRKGKYREGVIQVLVTSTCDKSCYACTQASNIRRKPWSMTPEQFEQAVRSLGFTGEREQDVNKPNFGLPIAPAGAYYGVVGLFGGNPALSPHFTEYCIILERLVPFNQRGIWCNNPITLDKAQLMSRTFDPSVSNLNVHLDQQAYTLFKQGWPSCHPVGLHEDSRHSPPFVAMKDVLIKQDGSPDSDRIHGLISNCDINQHWSAMIGVFRGELRCFFCEIAGAQAILHQHEPDYPDTGLDIVRVQNNPDGLGFCYIDEKTGAPHRNVGWWQLPMSSFMGQVRKHCFDCGVPLRGYGQLSQAPAGFEQVSVTHEAVYKPKTKDRKVEVVTNLVQLDVGKIQSTVRYLQNSKV